MSLLIEKLSKLANQARRTGDLQAAAELHAAAAGLRGALARCAEVRTLRDDFAMAAMQGIISNPAYFAALQNQAVELDRLGHGGDAFRLVAELAGEMAGAMMQERAK